MRKLSLIVAFLCFALVCGAQEFVHYTTRNGLSGTDVTAICEDGNYIWIGTNEGLNRFNGVGFKVYRRNPSNRNSLTENNIESLMLDSRGYLWIGLKTGGLDIYNPRTDSFTHIGDIISDYPKRVVSLLEDSLGNIWLGSWDEGLWQLAPDGGGDLSFSVTRHYRTSIISGLLETGDGHLWIGTYFGYFLYDIREGKAVDIGANSHSVTQFLPLPEGDGVLFSTWEDHIGKVSLNEETGRYEETMFRPRMEQVYRMTRADDGSYLLGTWGKGIRKFRLGEDRSEDVNFPEPVVLSFFKDRSGRLWIGTYGSGLYCISPDFGVTGIKLDALEGKTVNALLPLGDGTLLLGTQGGGLFRYGLEDGTLDGCTEIGGEDVFNRYILSLYRDRDVLIVGDDNTGLLYSAGGQYHRGGLRRFSTDSHFGKVTSVHCGADGRYWFGTKQEGLYSARFDRKEGFTGLRSYGALGTDVITGIADFRKSKLWISSYGGLYLFDTEEGTAEMAPGWNSGLAYDIVDDRNGEKLWIGTSDGLKYLSYSSEPYRVSTPDFSGMIPEGPVTRLVMDRDGNLWFSVGMRVFVYSTQSRHFKEIKLSGPQEDSFSSVASVYTPSGDGEIIFGGLSSLLTVETDRLLSREDESRIILSDIQLDGHPSEGFAPEYAENITLSWRTRRLQLGFSEVDAGVYRNAYKYYVDGYSHEWRPFDISAPLTLEQLSPGRYTLYVCPLSVDAEAPDEGLWHLGIDISAPWWRTVWFRVLLIALAVLASGATAAGLIVRYRKRQAARLEEMEKRKQEEILKEKDSFLSGLSHDLLTSCSLILAPVKDLLRDENINDDQRERLNIISKNADFLADLFSTIRDYRSAEMGEAEVAPKKVELVQFAGMTVTAFEYMAKVKGQEIAFESGVERLPVEIDTMKLERILYNLISNAIKYSGENGRIKVRLDFEPKPEPRIVIRVTDNGIGIADREKERIFRKYYRENEADSAGGLGLGLYTTRKFVEMMNGTVEVESELNCGSSFILTFPAVLDEENPEQEPQEAGQEFMVLLVEDNVQMREYLRKKFAEHFSVMTASGGAEAMDIIGRNLPELVVSDVMMPDMDGLELCRSIKGSPLYSDIFVILLTAKNLPEDEAAGYMAGADFYMKKPFDPDILIRQIQNVYATRQQRKKQIMASAWIPQNGDAGQSRNDVFLNRANEIVSRHLSDEEFSVEAFASELNVSKAVLFRKFRLLLNDTPSAYIRNIRLKKAAELLITTDLTVSEIGYMTGFSLVHYFIKRFRELYGDTPKVYRDKNRKR